MSRKEEKLLYHLTALDNLESIIKNGLMSRNNIKQFSFIDIADPEIIGKRNLKLALNDYVPFHFYMGTPFDGRVFLDNNNNGVKKKFIYLCVWRSYAKDNNWKIIPSHPLNEDNTQICDYEDGFSKIDWSIIDKDPMPNYLDNHEKEVCMAECDSPVTVSINSIVFIKSPDEETKKQVENILKKYNLNINVDVTHFSRKYYD